MATPLEKTPSFSLRVQVAMLLAVATLPVGVLAVAQGYATYVDALDLRRAALSSEASKASDRERGAISEAFGALDALQAQIEPSFPTEPCDAVMKAYVQSEKEVSFAGVAFTDGIIRCGYPLAEPLDVRGTPEYEKFINDPRRTVTVYERGAISGVPVVVATAPIRRNGLLTGSISVSTPSRYLNWANEPERDTDAHFAIVDGSGTLVAGQQADEDKSWLPEPETLKSLLQDARSTGILAANTGGDRLYAVKPLFADDIFSVSSWPANRASGTITASQLLMLLLPLVMWALAVVVAYFAVDRFALRHVVYLDRLVSAYARSERGLRAQGVRDAPLEFAKLGESFDRMAQEIENREDALRGSVTEKETLLKEVYHRVKNNLQMVCSLVNLQLRDAQNEHEREGLLRLQDRVHGLATVHQRLSEAEQVNAVRVDSLLEEIATSAKGSRASCDGEIKLTFDMVPYSEGPDRTIPLALFASEAIANAFKHALESGTIGWLRVSLQEGEAGTMVLEIANALPDGMPAPDTDRVGLGSQLIEGFTSQIRGTLEREITDTEYALRLTFPRSEEAE